MLRALLTEARPLAAAHDASRMRSSGRGRAATSRCVRRSSTCLEDESAAAALAHCAVAPLAVRMSVVHARVELRAHSESAVEAWTRRATSATSRPRALADRLAFFVPAALPPAVGRPSPAFVVRAMAAYANGHDGASLGQCRTADCAPTRWLRRTRFGTHARTDLQPSSSQGPVTRRITSFVGASSPVLLWLSSQASRTCRIRCIESQSARASPSRRWSSASRGWASRRSSTLCSSAMRTRVVALTFQHGAVSSQRAAAASCRATKDGHDRVDLRRHRGERRAAEADGGGHARLWRLCEQRRQVRRGHCDCAHHCSWKPVLDKCGALSPRD